MTDRIKHIKLLNRIISFILVGVMLFTLAACGKDKDGGKKDDSSKDSVSSSDTSSDDSSSDNNEQTDSTPSDGNNNIDDSSSSEEDYVYYRKDGSISPLATISLKGLTAEKATLSSNPDRGFRNETFIEVIEIAAHGPDKEDMVQAAYSFITSAKKDIVTDFGENVTLSFPYLYLDYWKYTGIDEECIGALDAIFEAHRRAGIKMIPNLIFQRDMTDDENGIGASQEIILDTINKLQQVIYDNRDVIYAFPLTSMQGAFGEGGHGGNENPRLNKTEIRNALVSQLIPEDTYIVSRMPEYKNEIEKALPAYDRIGFANHAFYGMLNFAAHGSGDFDPGNWRWEQAKAESAYTPNDAEFYVWGGYVEEYVKLGFYPDGLNVMRALSELHISSFSCVHGYVEAMHYYGTKREDTLFGLWEKDKITPAILDQYGFTYSTSWFKDSKGNDVERNALDYIRDHLGYRLIAQNVKVTGGELIGEEINVDMSLVNVGFGAVYNLESGFAIIDKYGEVVSSVEAGDPTDWHPTNPENYDDRTLLTHKISGTLELPEEEGEYKLVFYLKNSMGQYAQLANDIEFVNGYNVLHTFEM